MAVSATRLGMIGQASLVASVLVVQLSQIPLFLAVMSPSSYGSYLVLIAVPSTFTQVDFGLLGSTSTRLIVLVSQGKLRQARNLYRMTFTLLSCISLVVFAIVCCALIFVNIEEFGGVDSGAAIVLSYTAYALICLFSSSFEGLLRSVGAYGGTWVRFALIQLVDFGMGAAFMLITRNPVNFVLGMLISRIAGTIYLGIRAKRLATWSSIRFMRPRRVAMAGLLRPTLGSACIPLGNAIIAQGVIVAVNSSLGGSAAAVFSAVRTMINTLRQMSNIVANSIQPAMTQHYAVGSVGAAHVLLRRSLAGGGLLIVVGACFMYVCGRWILAVWTSGRLDVTGEFLALLLAQVAIEAFTLILSVRLVAQNKHFVFALSYLVSAVAVLACLLLLPPNRLEIVPIWLIGQSLVVFLVVLVGSIQTRPVAAADNAVVSEEPGLVR